MINVCVPLRHSALPIAGSAVSCPGNLDLVANAIVRVVAAMSAGIAGVNVRHVRLDTDDTGRLQLTNSKRTSAQMVEQLLEQLINVRCAHHS